MIHSCSLPPPSETKAAAAVRESAAPRGTGGQAGRLAAGQRDGPQVTEEIEDHGLSVDGDAHPGTLMPMVAVGRGRAHQHIPPPQGVFSKDGECGGENQGQTQGRLIL